MNTLIIQQKDFSVNIVDTSKSDGKQIVFSISVLAQARTQRNGKNIELYSIGGELLYILPFSGIKVQDIGGSAVRWAGTVDELLTKLNEEYLNNNVSGAGGGVVPNPLPVTATSLPLPTGAATEQEQANLSDKITDYLGKKAIGKILDLANTNGANSWGGYPLNLVDPPLFSFVFNFGLSFSIESGSAADNATELVSILNTSQNYIVFSVIDETTLLMNDGTKTLADLQSVTIDTSNFGDLFWDTFADSPAVSLSNLDEINERLKSVEANIQALAKLSDTQPVSISKLEPLNFDAFARLRMTQPETIFDSKQIADKQPLFFDDQAVSGAGTSSTYNTNQASTTLAVSNLTAGLRVRQTFQRFNYQPGKSFLFIRTGVFGTAGTGITKRLGLFDERNGLFFEQKANGMSVSVRTYTSGAAVDTNVLQANWNIDKMDGTGASGITLDYTKTLIYFCDFEWLGVGTVRFGFFIGGLPYYVHAINNSNINTVVYMSTPNLPLRTEIQNDGTGGVSSITDICSTVIIEGGRQTTGVKRGLNRETNTLVTNNNALIYPLIALRLKSTHFGALIKLISFNLKCTSTADYAWYIILNPTVTGTALSFTGLTNSSIEYAFPTNATTVSAGTTLDTGLGSDVNNNVKGVENTTQSDLVIGSNIAGTADIVCLAVQRLNGTTETFYSSLTFLDLL